MSVFLPSFLFRKTPLDQHTHATCLWGLLTACSLSLPPGGVVSLKTQHPGERHTQFLIQFIRFKVKVRLEGVN